jgi:hypothetical protein
MLTGQEKYSIIIYLGKFANSTVITTQTKDKENITMNNKIKYKQNNK